MKDPWRPCKAEASYAIGAKMNWIYYNFILEKKIKYFGFIEQDIMPIKTIDSLIKITSSANCFEFINNGYYDHENAAKEILYALFNK